MSSKNGVACLAGYAAGTRNTKVSDACFHSLHLRIVIIADAECDRHFNIYFRNDELGIGANICVDGRVDNDILRIDIAWYDVCLDIGK
ncbi:hypothetical protein D9M69_421460 [compost metagenome]